MLSDSPPERDLQWTETGINSSNKFILRLWELISKFESYNNGPGDNLAINKMKEAINKITEYIEKISI